MNPNIYPVYEGPKTVCDSCKAPFIENQVLAIDPRLDCVVCHNTDCLVWHCITTRQSINITEMRIFKSPDPQAELNQWPEEIDFNEFE